MIRRATADDAPEIARLSAQLGYPAAIAAFAERLRQLQSRDTHAVLVHVGEGNRLAGFVGLEQRLMIESGERVEIVGLVVDEQARRTGTGRRLVAAAEDWARAEAHPFYEQLGFLRTKTQHAYVKPLR